MRAPHLGAAALERPVVTCDEQVFARTHSHEATHASFGPSTVLVSSETVFVSSHHNCFPCPVKTLCEELKYSETSDLPPGTRLFGENMFGVHSIEYDNLSSFFYLFAVQWADGKLRVLLLRTPCRVCG